MKRRHTVVPYDICIRKPADFSMIGIFPFSVIPGIDRGKQIVKCGALAVDIASIKSQRFVNTALCLGKQFLAGGSFAERDHFAAFVW